MKTISVQTPKPSNIFLKDFLDRKTQKRMRAVLIAYEEKGINIQDVQAKFGKASKEDDEEKRKEILKSISAREQESVFDFQEAIALGIITKIKEIESGKEYDGDFIQSFLDEMEQDDFDLISKEIEKVMSKESDIEKKTKK